MAHYPDQYSKDSSDDEIFFGPITLREIKKRLGLEYYRQTIGCENSSHKNTSSTDLSLKLIETHSMPDIVPKTHRDSPANVKSISSPALSPKMTDLLTLTCFKSSPNLSPKTTSDWDIRPDDSFLQIEKMVSNLSMSPKSEFNEMRYTTPGIKKYLSNSKLQELKKDLNSDIKVQISNAEKQTQECLNSSPDQELKKTPVKGFRNDMLDIFSTPTTELLKTPVFKTPGKPVSQNKHLLTPKRYQHVVSPVATYIKQCPQVPLVKDVCPKKALPGISSIPKPIRHTPKHDIKNKENIKQEHNAQENVVFPTVAYKSAKKTKVIEIPDEGKLPQNQWAKQVASSIPRAVVLKHNYRQMNSAKKTLQKNEDSFANLSLQQADLSVCTQTSAFNKVNRNM